MTCPFESLSQMVDEIATESAPLLSPPSPPPAVQAREEEDSPLDSDLVMELDGSYVPHRGGFIGKRVELEAHAKYRLTVEGEGHLSKGGEIWVYLAPPGAKRAILFKRLDRFPFQTDIKSQLVEGEATLELRFRGHFAGGDRFRLDRFALERVLSNKGMGGTALILADFAKMADSVALNRLDFIRYLAQRSSRVVLFGTDHPKWRPEITIQQICRILGTTPETIIHPIYGYSLDEGGLLCQGLSAFHCRKALWVEDMHQGDLIARLAIQGRFTHVVYHCDCQELRAIRGALADRRFIHIPHPIRTDEFRHYGYAKSFDFILYGAHSADYYPFRDRLYRLIREHPGFKVKYIPFAGYTGEKARSMPRGAELAALINQAWIGVATCSRVDYLVKKYLEIPASYAMVAGNLPSRGADLFKGRIIELTEQMTDRQILDVLEGALADKRKLLRQIDQLHRLVQGAYSYRAIYGLFERALL